MIAVPTTTVSVLPFAPSSVDVYDDPAADNTPSAVGVPASILEQRQTATTPADDRTQTVRSFVARLPAGTPIAAPARLFDEQAGVMYLVDDVAPPASPYTTLDIRADLHRVD